MAGKAQDESVEVGGLEVWGHYVVEALFLGHLVGVLGEVFVVSHIKGACLDSGSPRVLGRAVGEVVFWGAPGGGEGGTGAGGADGVWCMVNGRWRMVDGLWCTVEGLRCLILET